MIQKFLIKAIPYIIIVLILVFGYFYISSLKKDIKDLNGVVCSQTEVIKQYQKTVEDLKKDSQTAQKEQDKDKEEHHQAEQELIKYNETIEQFVKEPKDTMIANLNKYNECLAKNFNNGTDCSKFLKVSTNE